MTRSSNLKMHKANLQTISSYLVRLSTDILFFFSLVSCLVVVVVVVVVVLIGIHSM